jgi:hypothetical protein
MEKAAEGERRQRYESASVEAKLSRTGIVPVSCIEEVENVQPFD